MKTNVACKILILGVLTFVLIGCSSSEESSVPTSEDPALSITPTPTVEPTPTDLVTPKITTSNPPPTITGFDYSAHGITLHLDDITEITEIGWLKAEADETQGLLSFKYGGTNVLLLWIQQADATAETMLADKYQMLRTTHPDLNFAPLTEGAIDVAGVAGEYGGFVITDSSDKMIIDGELTEIGGGLIGSWVCPQSNTAMALTVISANATTLQVRFNRLLQGVEC